MGQMQYPGCKGVAFEVDEIAADLVVVVAARELEFGEWATVHGEPWRKVLLSRTKVVAFIIFSSLRCPSGLCL